MNTGAFVKGMLYMAGIFLALISLLGFFSGIVASTIGGTTGSIIAALVTAVIVFLVAAVFTQKRKSQGGRYWIAGILAVGTVLGVLVSQRCGGGLSGILSGGATAALADAVLLILWVFVVPKPKLDERH